MNRVVDAAPSPRVSLSAFRPEQAVPLAAAAIIGLATVIATLLSNGSLVASIAPVLVGAVLWLIWVAPIRLTLCVVMLIGLSVDRPGDSEGRWASPFITIGGMLFQNLNKVVSIEALKFSGVFLLLCYLLVIRGYRVLRGRARDTEGSLQPAAPMLWGISIALLTMFAAVTFGALRGGDLQMAKIQVQAYLQLLAVAYLFSVSLRGERDYRLLAKVIVAAACVKAVMAMWVRMVLPPAFPDQWGIMRELQYATNHGDSILFACAIAVLVGPWFHRPAGHRLRTVLLIVPVIIMGIIANDRRIAWVQVAVVLFVLIGMNWRSGLTRRIARVTVLMSPLLVAYVVVGWSSSSGIFSPVRFVRGIVQPEMPDGSIDRSTLYRDIENFNLVYTFQTNPVMGTGFGHPFGELVKGDSLSTFKEYAYLPHNSMLGIWAFTGGVGFTGIFSILTIALFLGIRSHARAVRPDQATAATAAIGCLGAYVIHLWADIGFTEAPTIFLVGLAIAVTGQLAAATGAWPSRWRHAGTFDR